MRVSSYEIVPKHNDDVLPTATPVENDEANRGPPRLNKKTSFCLGVLTTVLLYGALVYRGRTQSQYRPSAGGSDGEDQLPSVTEAVYDNFIDGNDVHYEYYDDFINDNGVHYDYYEDDFYYGDNASSYGSSDEKGTDWDDESAHEDEEVDDQYVFVKLLSVGDVRPSEASVDDIVVKINDRDNVLSQHASTFDGVAWNNGISPDWNIFSYGTSFMTAYGTLRPWQDTSSYADIYGDQEGIWAKVPTKGVIEKVSLSVSLKFGRGYTDTRRYYRMQVGVGNSNDDDQSFEVVAEVIAAPTSEVPGNTYWKEYTATWEASCPFGLLDVNDRHTNCKAYPYQNGFYRSRFGEGCDKYLEYDGNHSKCFEYCNQCDESACRAACRGGCDYMLCETEYHFRLGCNNPPPTEWEPMDGIWDTPDAVNACPFPPLSLVSANATLASPSLIPGPPPAFYQIVLPRPLVASKVKVKLTGNFKGTIFLNGNSGVMELLAVLFYCDGVDVTQSVSRVEGNDESQGGAHIRRPINLVQPYKVVQDPPDPWGQWGPGLNVFDQGPQGQGLWTGTVRMTEGGMESEDLVFYFSTNQKITDISFYRNKDDEYRERFPRKIEVEVWP